jgi:hypothetical protein
MNMTIERSKHNNGILALQSFPNANRIKFGRDEIFERNDRFETMFDTDQGQLDALERLITQKAEKPSVEHARKIAEHSAFLYNAWGRVRGKGALPLAVKAAVLEYRFLKDSPYSTPVEVGLAGIKLANAQLAQDKKSAAAFRLLKSSLQMLQKAGFNPTPGNAPPIYVHGLYNRGTYFFNNDIYKETTKLVLKEDGKEELAIQVGSHEGLLLQFDMLGRVFGRAAHELREGLPFLEQAIHLVKNQGDDRIPLIEYLSAKGEVQHALSHLTGRNKRTHQAHDQEALDAFQAALEQLKTVPKEKQTARHFKLLEKIGGIRLPHMCSRGHVPNRTAAFQCIATTREYRHTLDSYIQNGVQMPPDTDEEKLAKSRSLLNLFGGFLVIRIG